MKHKIEIWSRRLERKAGKSANFTIESKIELTEGEICAMALAEWKDGNMSLREDKEYFAEISETVH